MPELSHTPSFLRPRRRGFALIGILTAFAFYNWGVEFVLNTRATRSEVLVAFLFGGCAAQPLVLGLWGALGPGSLRVRLPLIVATVFCLVVAVSLPAFIEKEGTASAIFFSTGGIALLVMLAAIPIGALARWWTRQSVQYALTPSASEKQAYQFSLKHLLSLTTLFAVILAITSRFARDLEANRFLSPANLVMQFIVTSAVASAVVLPTAAIPWTMLSLLPREPLIALGALFWCIWTCILIAVVASFNRGRGPEIFLIAGQAGAATIATFCGLALRASGYRLLSRSPRRDIGPSGPTSTTLERLLES